MFESNMKRLDIDSVLSSQKELFIWPEILVSKLTALSKDIYCLLKKKKASFVLQIIVYRSFSRFKKKKSREK